MTYLRREQLPDVDPNRDLKYFSRELERMLQDPTEKYAPPLLVATKEGKAERFIKWSKDNLKQHQRSDPSVIEDDVVFNLITIEKSIPVIANHDLVESLEVDRGLKIEI